MRDPGRGKRRCEALPRGGRVGIGGIKLVLRLAQGCSCLQSLLAAAEPGFELRQQRVAGKAGQRARHGGGDLAANAGNVGRRGRLKVPRPGERRIRRPRGPAAAD